MNYRNKFAHLCLSVVNNFLKYQKTGANELAPNPAISS